MIIKVISILIMGCAAFINTQFPHVFPPLQEQTVTGWRADFDHVVMAQNMRLPEGWRHVRKPGTTPAVFSITEVSAGNVLHMESDRASSSVITQLEGVDIEKTPILRWRWRATKLPEGADGRSRDKDDQAIGIYVGAGTSLNSKSVSYRWDTLTPKGVEGNSAYGLGGVKVKWYTLRNEGDAGSGRWFTEERNVRDDFMKAWGFYPKKIFLVVSSNSQYTKSKAAADLGDIGFYDK